MNDTEGETQNERMARRYEEGWSLMRIAAHEGVSDQTVSVRLRAMGVAIRRKWGWWEEEPTRRRAETKDAVIPLWLRGLNQGEIAKATARSQSAVCHIVQGAVANGEIEDDLGRNRRVVMHSLRGHSPEWIAEREGVAADDVPAIVNALSRWFRTAPGGEKPLDRLVRDGARRGLSCAEIAKRLHHSKVAIQKRLVGLRRS